MKFGYSDSRISEWISGNYKIQLFDNSYLLSPVAFGSIDYANVVGYMDVCKDIYDFVDDQKPTDDSEKDMWPIPNVTPSAKPTPPPESTDDPSP